MKNKTIRILRFCIYEDVTALIQRQVPVCSGALRLSYSYGILIQSNHHHHVMSCENVFFTRFVGVFF